MYFEGHPRVTVDQSPCQFRYREHGRVLLGFTHGHMRKWNDLPSIMATDQPEAWGRTRARYFHLGHIHSDTTGKDPTGCKLESHRTLAPADAWAYGSGYRSQRDAKVITYDHHGEWNRCTINLARVGLDPAS